MPMFCLQKLDIFMYSLFP
uniref:Uncharacterized protein n=1 Tax=Rhizophora mucronata TaxID=61149 RepID=A0A2P2NSM8_RHIMU